jgi:hypothetical protein
VRVLRDFFLYFSNVISINGCDLLFRNFMRSISDKSRFIRQSEWKNQTIDWLYKHFLNEIDNHATISVDMVELIKIWKEIAAKLTYIYPGFDPNMTKFSVHCP